MTKIKEAKELLRDLDVPVQQQSDLCALVILALARLQPMMNGFYQQIIGFESMTYCSSSNKHMALPMQKIAVKRFVNKLFITLGMLHLLKITVLPLTVLIIDIV